MKPSAYVLYIILGFIFGLSTLIIGFVFDWVYGQDIDPRYVCLYKDQYPFNKMCRDQMINGLVNNAVKLANENDAKFCQAFANLSYCQERNHEQR